jgi:hypothetical protein
MIQLREAVSTDNAGLLNLTSLLPMEGRISIRIDRNPDFFKLLNVRGPGKVFIAEREGYIIGCFSVSVMDILVNGIPDKVYYLADLKIHPSCVGTTLTSRLLFVMSNYLRNIGADLLFSTAALGNEKVLSLFSGRIGLPKFQGIGTFKVYQIIPLIKKAALKTYRIEELLLNDEILEIYSCFSKRYSYSPALNKTNLQGNRHLVASQKDEIVASISLIDMGESKQNVLIRLPPTLNILVSLLKKLNKLFNVLNLPAYGEPIKIMYIKAFAYREGHAEALDLLITHARKLCFKDKYCFLSVGIHDKDPSASFFRRYLHFTFNSLGYISSLKNDNDKVRNITWGIVYEDYSLI